MDGLMRRGSLYTSESVGSVCSNLNCPHRAVAEKERYSSLQLVAANTALQESRTHISQRCEWLESELQAKEHQLQQLDAMARRESDRRAALERELEEWKRLTEKRRVEKEQVISAQSRDLLGLKEERDMLINQVMELQSTLNDIIMSTETQQRTFQSREEMQLASGVEYMVPYEKKGPQRDSRHQHAFPNEYDVYMQSHHYHSQQYDTLKKPEHHHPYPYSHHHHYHHYYYQQPYVPQELFTQHEVQQPRTNLPLVAEQVMASVTSHPSASSSSLSSSSSSSVSKKGGSAKAEPLPERMETHDTPGSDEDVDKKEEDEAHKRSAPTVPPQEMHTETAVGMPRESQTDPKQSESGHLCDSSRTYMDSTTPSATAEEAAQPRSIEGVQAMQQTLSELAALRAFLDTLPLRDS